MKTRSIPRPARRAGIAGSVAACVLAAGALALALQPARSAGPPLAHPDPVREAFLHATAPALGDSSRVRLRAFIAANPRHPLAREAWLELGSLAYAQGEYAQARDDFRRARGGAVADQARLWEARSLLANGFPRDALALVQPLSHARRGTPLRWEAGEIVALSLTNEGKRAAALTIYRELLSGPAAAGDASALFQAIALADELGSADDARAWRERLTRAYPQSPEAASVRSAGPPAPRARP